MARASSCLGELTSCRALRAPCWLPVFRPSDAALQTGLSHGHGPVQQAVGREGSFVGPRDSLRCAERAMDSFPFTWKVPDVKLGFSGPLFTQVLEGVCQTCGRVCIFSLGSGHMRFREGNLECADCRYLYLPHH